MPGYHDYLRFAANRQADRDTERYATYRKYFGKTLLDKDIESIFITDSDVRHIKKNHGQGEAARGQVDITPEDFALIPAVMNEFDTARHEDIDRMGNKKILFVKKVNGNIYTASVERGNSQIGVITFWKTKARPGA